MVCRGSAAAGVEAFVDTDLVGSLRWASSRLLFRVGSLVVSIGLVASRGPSIVVVVVVAEEANMAPVAVAVATTDILVDTHLAGNIRMKLADSPLGPESPVDGLRNSRQILPGVGPQGADCRTPQVGMAGLVDDTGRHTVPVDYRSAAVGCPDTLARQDCCLPLPVGPVAWESACLWVSGLSVCLVRRRCGTRNRDRPPGTLSQR